MSDQKAKVDEATRREWRELGFFYDYDEKQACWRLIGSRAGLLRLCDLLDQYVGDPRNDKISEHDHYGPYMYLEVMTWHEAQITDHAVSGSLNDLRRLSALCREKLTSAKPGNVVSVDKEYSPSNTAKLQLEVREDNFDPAIADPQLSK